MDEFWMERALDLAALGGFTTSPNPMVGAVVLDAKGQLVGEGFHAAAGRPHGEALALQQAGARARGGSLYVTLEPCCHHGRTPPCTEAVLAAGIRRVVAAMADPDPRVAGGGLERLRQAGLTVIQGVGEARARTLNRAFLHRVRHGRPWGVLKWAASVDGRIATKAGDSQWISGVPARQWVHRLRSRCDAVLVGAGTVRSDNPLLTSRGQRQPEPRRVVVSPRLRLPHQARLWDQTSASTMVFHGPAADPAAADQLERQGVECIALEPCSPRGVLENLARRGCNRVLWECGPALAAAAVQEGCVQEIAAVQAPKLLGGLEAFTPLGDLGITTMAQSLPLGQPRLERCGDDLIWRVHLETPTGTPDGFMAPYHSGNRPPGASSAA
ncbi:MAG: bifunctional diaminohydroxyphosphoribosylaminopyrimidine deaminase/5-amino-6-(5-phosphoribosylamino)uracil reductase RibD [Cyanobacteria bacterium MAG CAR1_bin_15]|nr:bifunctional diaminohydroxyphosphoribosylaminopyrimidine deaminase/5-amino-6-(5-phosphoribosylamino)uracil reductase RibD [Cyanobacteria bacterium MAG CAR1_bin_15]